MGERDSVFPAQIRASLERAKPVDDDCQESFLAHAIDAGVANGAILETNPQLPLPFPAVLGNRVVVRRASRSILLNGLNLELYCPVVRHDMVV
jgi:hypothetical protein